MSSNKAFTVTTPDGVSISAQATGNPGGAEILFIHGLMQCHLSWAKQITSALADEFRLVTYDVRGHGGSDAPLDPACYATSDRYADELDAIIKAAALKRPVLVGWSFGTRIIADYLLKYGTRQIAGIDLVAAILSPNPDHFGTGIPHVVRARDDDYATSVAGTRALVRSCFARQPTQEEFETMLVFNSRVPVKVRQWMVRKISDADAVQSTLRSLDVPALITHGAEDLLPKVELGKWLATIIPGSELSIYEGVGHALCFEDPERFNRELAAFVRKVHGTG